MDETDGNAPLSPTPWRRRLRVAAGLFVLPWVAFFAAPDVAVQYAVLMFLCMAVACAVTGRYFIGRAIAQFKVQPSPPPSHFLAYAVGPLAIWATSRQLAEAAAAAAHNLQIPAVLRSVFAAVGATWPMVGNSGLAVAVILAGLAWGARKR